MKKRIILLLILLSITTVNAKTYFISKMSNNKEKEHIITNNDNYNYGDFVIHQEQTLIVSIEEGILSNDIIKTDNYKIVLYEYSDNSVLNNIKLDLNNGSFSYKPDLKVKGKVIFEYYITYEIDGVTYRSNTSFITFRALEKEVSYVINYYEENTNKIIDSVIKYGNYGNEITEFAKNIDKYNKVKPDKINKILGLKNNNFDFYYSNIPNTGI